SLKTNWEAEIRRWAPSLSTQRIRGDASDRRAWYRLPLHVLLASYEEIRADLWSLPSDVTFDVVVLDEAQRIKHADGQTARACRSIQRTRSWALTGTPVENSAADLIAICRFIKRGL